MALTTTSTLPAFLRAGIDESFGLEYGRYSKEYLKFFDQVKSTQAYEVYREIGGLGLHTIKEEGAPSAFDAPVQGAELLLHNKSYSLGYSITHEAMEDYQYQEVLNKAKELGLSAAQTVETVVIDRLNTAFSTASADILANGQAMCSATQPIIKTGATISNLGSAGDLAESTLTTALNEIAAFQDPSGKKIKVTAEMLIVPQATDIIAQKLLKSTLEVSGNNNDINPFGRENGRIPKGYIVSQFITDSNAWFVRTSSSGLVYQEREMPARQMEDFKARTMDKDVISFMRFAVGCFDFRSIYGNPGS